jgi:hypothetical protein
MSRRRAWRVPDTVQRSLARHGLGRTPAGRIAGGGLQACYDIVDSVQDKMHARSREDGRMTTTRRIGLAGALLGLAVLVGAEAGWAACCKCTPCVEPGVACFTTPDTQDSCELKCPVAFSGFCNFDSFSAAATCGRGEFADCSLIDGWQVKVRAPVMGFPATGVTAIGMLIAGAALLARRARRDG